MQSDHQKSSSGKSHTRKITHSIFFLLLNTKTPSGVSHLKYQKPRKNIFNSLKSFLLTLVFAHCIFVFFMNEQVTTKQESQSFNSQIQMCVRHTRSATISKWLEIKCSLLHIVKVLYKHFCMIQFWLSGQPYKPQDRNCTKSSWCFFFFFFKMQQVSRKHVPALSLLVLSLTR